MMKLKLERPSPALKQAFLSFTEDWARNGEEITPYGFRLLGRSYEEWLSDAARMETEAPAGFVPAHCFCLTGGTGTMLGAIQIRHRLNDALLRTGGHIGYGVRPSERRKGYAEAMLALALPRAKRLGIERVLITCAKENAASARTILHCGGVLENEIPEEGRVTQRYWIDLSRLPR